ncbi:hydrogenase/urease accessory protein HupE [Paenibacillus shirakamiensis]|uniref:Hydrogenase/urease accessory protein HupE n=1 Tax=Paenibacillus shirakamiensis TaxID=1265935 RepID=A0ABS4JL88_9BACL|nr:HupE/UreJ family protein [Paenibacillus shirakamiensis]MBP2001359.1 hydrogenase/urease accessory protein HupE [Paenibacillus shirakamiensis]
MLTRPLRLSCYTLITIMMLSMITMTFSNFKVSAHALSASYTTVTLNKDTTNVAFSLDVISVMENIKIDTNGNGIIEQSELDSHTHALEEWISDSVVLDMNSREQTPHFTAIKLENKADKEVITWDITYPAFQSGQTIAITDGLYAEPSSSTYVNLITARYQDQVSDTVLQGKNRTWTMLLTEEQQQQQLNTPAGTNGNAGSGTTNASHSGSSTSESGASTIDSSDGFSFFKLGMNHILTGYDHLLFLFALLLRKQSFKQYASIITAFTIAHSITLSLAVLGWISVPSRIVESVIALSICYVALENIFRKNIRYRWAITFMFGLIHGIGFSDILRAMNLPKGHLAVDLISFNLGIEFIQISIVLILLPILALLQKKNFFKPAVIYGSWIITTLGAFWLVERLFF